MHGYPLIDGYESEWGSEQGFGESVEEFCSKEGYQLLKIRFDEPNQFNRLAFRTVKKLVEMDGREPAGVLVEVFSQYDATAVMQTGLIPLWLIFNTNDSVRFLAEMEKEFPAKTPIFFSPLSTFSLTPDMAKWYDWIQALAGNDWINIGTRESHYPADTWTLIEWQNKLQKWCEDNWNPIKSIVTIPILEKLVQEINQENENQI